MSCFQFPQHFRCFSAAHVSHLVLHGEKSAPLTALIWGGGNTTTRALNGDDANDPSAFPRARYLSQQFVEDLCSARGASEGLIREIERVIYEAHPEDELEGAADFTELLENRTVRFQESRRREVEAIASISDRIADELEIGCA